jgi:hypothetical protein
VNAPRSARSVRLGRRAWQIWIAGALANLIFDLSIRTGWVQWALALPITLLWAGIFIAFLVSRLNDTWDQEIQDRRGLRL